MSAKVILSASLLVASAIALACDCPRLPTEDIFVKSTVVAYGVVSDIKPYSSANELQKLVGNFQPLEIFKGSAQSIKTVLGSERHSPASCMVKLEPGEYVLFTDNEFAHITFCSASINISKYSAANKSALLNQLRELSKRVPKE